MMESSSSSGSGSSSSSCGVNSLLWGLEKTVGKDLLGRIQSCKILLVGAGGIGCELLKNLALSGFQKVEVIDLDTIDVSNLNRQFLFRSHHVGMPKCTVGCEVAAAMCPESPVSYKAHHGNVCDNSRFDVMYVKSFDLVLNALDNLNARRRVNRLCLAAGVPLVEAGTTGYLGQVTVIDKASDVECYECQTKPTQKVYPICTIRSTPSQPVHTIVWAKELYKLLFHPKIEESMLYEDDNNNNNNTEEEADEDSEPSTYMTLVRDLRAIRSSSVDKKDATKVRKQAGLAFIALFETEINKQLAMDRYKTAQKIPKPLSAETISKVASNLENRTAPYKRDTYKASDVWSIEDCLYECLDCIVHSTTDDSVVVLPEFDKDDVMCMRFVTAASNLRSYVFGIQPIQSYYAAKGIAGNIIPAIATTNAIVAGLQILQVFHILKQQMLNKPGTLKEVCKYIYCLRDSTRKGYYLQPTTLPPPNPKCFVCRNAILHLTINTHTWLMSQLLQRIIKQELGFVEPSISIGDNMIYEEGEGADTDCFLINLPKTLHQLPCGGIQNGTILKIEDFTQDLEVDICFTHQHNWEAPPSKNNNNTESEQIDPLEQFTLGGDKPIKKQTTTDTNTTDNSETHKQDDNNHNDDDDIEIISSDKTPVTKDVTDTIPTKKRSLDTSTDNHEDLNNTSTNCSHVVKKPKIDDSEKDEIIILD